MLRRSAVARIQRDLGRGERRLRIADRGVLVRFPDIGNGLDLGSGVAEGRSWWFDIEDDADAVSSLARTLVCLGYHQRNDLPRVHDFRR